MLSSAENQCLEPGCKREANSERPAYCIRHLKSDHEAQRMQALRTKLREAQEEAAGAKGHMSNLARDVVAATKRAEAAEREPGEQRALAEELGRQLLALEE